jgi:hypothetical protein
VTETVGVDPVCPRGHDPETHRFVRDGRYGSVNPRQRYRCVAPDGAFHRFTPPLPRERTHGGVCLVCDTTVAAHAGPVVSRAYRHRLHLVAEALVAVGRGVSYTRAAQRARVAGGRDPLDGDSAGQMVAEWVDVWAPVVIEALAETEWPETLVLDGTDFFWTNARTRTRRRAFAVLTAYGYTGARQGRMWGAVASPTARAGDFVDLLTSLRLPAPPRTIVADDSRAITAAVRRVWPPAPGPSLPLPFLFSCEHHLRQGAEAALALHNAHPPQGRWMRRLDTAFRRDEAWDEFTTATAGFRHGAAWVQAHEPQLSVQTSVRHLLPAHYSNAAAEQLNAALRGMFERRSFALRNKQRTNLLLGLARLHLNNRDDVGTYHRVLREAAEAGAARPATAQRVNRDRRGAPSLR